MKEFDCDIFCDRVISLFGDAGQVELSQKIGISQGVISAIKNKKAKAPASDTVFKIAQHFNISADWLLGLSDIRTTDGETRDICAALGLSEKTVDFLSGKTNTQMEVQEQEAFKEELRSGAESFFDFLRHQNEYKLFRVRNIIGRLVEEYVELYFDEEREDISLLALIESFEDRLYLSPMKHIIALDLLDLKLDEDTKTDLKSLLISEAIQDINSYLVSRKNKVLKEGEADEKS